MDVQSIIGAVGFFVGVIYIVGGLIVNLHLSQFGITEYQILRIKYLVVGLTYLTNFGALLLLAALPALVLTIAAPLIQQAALVLSLLASVALLWLWGRSSAKSRQAVFRSWISWLVVGTLSSIFPLMASLRVVFRGQVDVESGVLLIQAILAGTLAFIGQTYFFARFLYGRPTSTFGSVDPIGMGIPVNVQLAGDAANISLLKKMGVPSLQPELTDTVLLLDETDTHYILGTSSGTSIQALKVDKNIVKAILYSD